MAQSASGPSFTSTSERGGAKTLSVIVVLPSTSGLCRDGLPRIGLPAAVGLHLLELAALVHFHGAVLELRDLAERVERRVGEAVGRRLVEGERDEDGAARRAL